MSGWTGGQIRDFRKRHGLLQRELAALVGVTREHIVALEKEVKRPSDTLCLLLECLDRQMKNNKERRK
jgi:DNA-binding XRE family transcriptional regulator